MEVNYTIPAHLESRFRGLSEQDICSIITSSLENDKILNRLCLDIRIEQAENYKMLQDRISDLENKLSTGAVSVASNGVKGNYPPVTNEEKKPEVKAYVKQEEINDEEEDDDFMDFMSMITK